MILLKILQVCDDFLSLKLDILYIYTYWMNIYDDLVVFSIAMNELMVPGLINNVCF